MNTAQNMELEMGIDVRLQLKKMLANFLNVFYFENLVLQVRQQSQNNCSTEALCQRYKLQFQETQQRITNNQFDKIIEQICLFFQRALKNRKQTNTEDIIDLYCGVFHCEKDQSKLKPARKQQIVAMSLNMINDIINMCLIDQEFITMIINPNKTQQDRKYTYKLLQQIIIYTENYQQMSYQCAQNQTEVQKIQLPDIVLKHIQNNNKPQTHHQCKQEIQQLVQQQQKDKKLIEVIKQKNTALTKILTIQSKKEADLINNHIQELKNKEQIIQTLNQQIFALQKTQQQREEPKSIQAPKISENLNIQQKPQQNEQINSTNSNNSDNQSDNKESSYKSSEKSNKSAENKSSENSGSSSSAKSNNSKQQQITHFLSKSNQNSKQSTFHIEIDMGSDKFEFNPKSVIC